MCYLEETKEYSIKFFRKWNAETVHAFADANWANAIAIFADTDQPIHLNIEHLSKSITLEKRNPLDLSASCVIWKKPKSILSSFSESGMQKQSTHLLMQIGRMIK